MKEEKKVPAKTTKAAKAPAPATKAVAVRPKAAPPAPPKSLAARIAADSGVGAGLEGADKDSFAIPFIRVLQDGSPQTKAGQVGFVKGAKSGMLFNTVTSELFGGDEGIVFIPCAFQRRFIRWGPRGAENSGYKGELMPEDVAEKLSSGEIVKSEDDGKLYFGPGTNPKKDDRASDTRNHFGLVLTEHGPVQALLSLTSTQIKKSKQLMGILSGVAIDGKTPPTWMNKIRITTLPESNDLGNWNGIRVEHEGFIDDEVTYDAGKAFHDIIAAGKAHVNYADLDNEEPSDATGDGGEPERF